jgi:2-keto-4-pentenoate hydratase
MKPSDINKAAALLLESLNSGIKIEALPGDLVLEDQDAAYRIQDRVVSLIGNTCGWKIGLTSKSARAAFKTDAPMSGRLFTNHLLNSPCVVRSTRYALRGIEAEIVCVVGSNVPKNIGALSIAEIDNLIVNVIPGIEICDSRVVDCDQVGLNCIIADNANGAALAILDSPVAATYDELEKLNVRLAVGESQVLNGCAKNVFEHPYRAVQWLCKHLQGRGLTLSPGDLIATGSMAPFTEATGEDAVTADFEMLGTVRVQFTGA